MKREVPYQESSGKAILVALVKQAQLREQQGESDPLLRREERVNEGLMQASNLK